MAKLPLRVLGFLLLTVSLGVASCQAFIHGLAIPVPAQALESEQRTESIDRNDHRREP